MAPDTRTPSALTPPDGWLPFGTLAALDYVPDMEFSTEHDEVGDPLWERVRRPDTRTPSAEARCALPMYPYGIECGRPAGHDGGHVGPFAIEPGQGSDAPSAEGPA